MELETPAWFWLGFSLLLSFSLGGVVARTKGQAWANKRGWIAAAAGLALVVSGLLASPLAQWFLGSASSGLGANRLLMSLLLVGPFGFFLGFSLGLKGSSQNLSLFAAAWGAGALLSGLAWLPTLGLSKGLWLLGTLVGVAGILVQMAGQKTGDHPEDQENVHEPLEEFPGGFSGKILRVSFPAVVTAFLALQFFVFDGLFVSMPIKAGALLGWPVLIFAMGYSWANRGTQPGRARAQVGFLGMAGGLVALVALVPFLPHWFLQTLASTGTSVSAYLVLRWAVLLVGTGLFWFFAGWVGAGLSRMAGPNGSEQSNFNLWAGPALLAWFLVFQQIPISGVSLRSVILVLAIFSLLGCWLARFPLAADVPPPKGYWLNWGLPLAVFTLGLLTPAWPAYEDSHQVFLNPHQYLTGTPTNLIPFFPEPLYLDQHGERQREGSRYISQKPFTQELIGGRGAVVDSGNLLSGRAEVLAALLPAVYRPEAKRWVFLGISTGLGPASVATGLNPEQLTTTDSDPGAHLVGEQYLSAWKSTGKVPMGSSLGTEYLQTGPRAYLANAQENSVDVLVLSSFHPMDGGAPLLLTREHFLEADKVLPSSGIALVHFSLEHTSSKELWILVATLKGVFGHVQVHFSGQSALFVASQESLVWPTEPPHFLPPQNASSPTLPLSEDSEVVVTSVAETGAPTADEPSWLKAFGLSHWSYWQDTLVGDPEGIRPQWEFSPQARDDRDQFANSNRSWRLSNNLPDTLAALADIQSAAGTSRVTLLDSALTADSANGEQSFTALTKILDTDPDNKAVLVIFRQMVLLQAENQMSDNRPDRALALLGACIKYDAKQEEVLVQAGEAFYASRKAQQSRSLFEQAYQINHKNPLTLLRLADLALKRNDLEMAGSLLDQLGEPQRNLQLYRALKSNHAFKSGFTDEAVVLLTQLQRDFPQSEEYWYRLGLVYLGVEDGIRARKTLEKGLRKMNRDDQISFGYWQALAKACTLLGDESAAQEYRAKAPSPAPGPPGTAPRPSPDAPQETPGANPQGQP